MITKEEMGKIAGAKRLSVESCEKDYLLELVLFSICSEFGDALIFKGGTALYKLYSLNRFSEDLDFTLNKRKFDFEKMARKIILSLERLGIEGKVKEFSKYRNEVNIRFIFYGPLYRGSRESMVFVSINISLRERVLGFEKEIFIPSYKEIPSFDIFVMEPKEILAEKVRAIYSRNKPRDVYDLWFLLKRGEAIDFKLIEKKLKIVGIKFSQKDFLKKIHEKENLWERDLEHMIIGNLPDFKTVEKEILFKFTS